MSDLRQRKVGASARSEKVAKAATKVKKHAKETSKGSSRNYTIANVVMTVLALVLRFYKLNHPDEVVFDEVHFGKFASYYLERTYFFDLHPPFAKLMFAGVGYLVGFDGKFKFEQIGDSYVTHGVPYLAFRSFSALLGSLTVPVVFKTMQESGYSVQACVFGTSILLLDNAHIAETRLILLDAMLIFALAISLYSYVKFSKLRSEPFSRQWYKWLLLTGVSLSCVISTKFVGVFTYSTIGVAVLIDLWNLLDWKVGLTMRQFLRHFMARFYCLIVFPFFIFLFWFWVHFTVLSKSGPGDNFMSPEFQETLGENPLLKQAKQVNYHDIVTIKHKEIGAFLHSHEDKYPLRYDDGRISSQGQQVTAYTNNDINNYWEILPDKVVADGQKNLNVPVMDGHRIRLRHVETDTILYTHDVASPLFPTNEEVTTVSLEEAEGEKFNGTLFQFKTENRGVAKTKATYFKLIHVVTKVAIWSHSDVTLPEWAYNQFEVNGNKNIAETSNLWVFDEIIGLTDPVRLNHVAKKPKSLPFWTKYIELQASMFTQNNALTAHHPYASEPITWPWLYRGVSFWTNDDARQQIYFIGNFVGWWMECVCIAAFLGIVLIDQLSRRRGIELVNRASRAKLYNSAGFFFVGWATHYFPFFLMGRQKFLHHYLPAHLTAALLSGSVFDIFCGEFDEEVQESKKAGDPRRAVKLFLAIFLAVLVLSFTFVAPLTYGTPSLSIEEVQARQILGIQLHFAK